MRGEHCVAGASILSAIALILLVFANIGQVSPGALTKDIYMAEINVAAYGNAVSSIKGNTTGLYDTSTSALGQNKGLRQFYRFGLYQACGYQKGGDKGVCNSTIFGYPMVPMEVLLSDTPKGSAQKQLVAIIDNPDSTFKDDSMNRGMSRAGSLLIFVGSCLVALSLIFGVIRARIFFLVAAATAGLGALLLMVGAALWTALIAKDNWIQKVKVENGANLGIYTTAGPTLYLTWVAFAITALSVLPYVVACCTFRRN